MSEFKNNNLKTLYSILENNSKLLQQTHNNNIKKDLQFGLSVRTNILIENIIGIHKALENENSFNLTMQINSLYIHIKGILDNLASIINTKLNLSIENKFHIVLTHQNFKNELKNYSNDLFSLIEDDFKDWLKNIKEKRDPIAHRKPLYVPPKIITSKEENDKLDNINNNLSNEKNPDNIYSHIVNIQNEQKFHSYFIQYDGSKINNIEEIISSDLTSLKNLYFAIFQSLSKATKKSEYSDSENYFKRVTMSLTDIQICLKYIEKSLECQDDIVNHALQEAIIISYVRPFSGYNKNYHQITDLKKEFKKQFIKDEIKIHDRVCKMRNSIIAHSDSKSYGVQINIFELDENLKMAIPMQRGISTILSCDDMQILKSCCLKIETYLFDEQTRLKDILPIGTY